MNIKTIFQWTPWWLLGLLVFFSLVASLDGVIFAEIIGRLSALDESVTQSEVVGLAVYALALRLSVFLGMYFNYQVKAKIEQVLNKRLKENYLNNIYHSQNAIKASESISIMTTDYEVISEKYFGVIFDIFGYLLMLITSIIYILSINFKYGLVFVSVSLLALLPSFLFSQSLNQRTLNFLDNNQYFLARLLDIIHGMKTIKTYHQEKTIQQSMKRVSIKGNRLNTK
ncbi:ABC transporter ATP-binding protein [Aerococcaceae bacterium DSM 111020]|nr:ABC transporter ATP-binding protein [Aerococcaceae bacterium DSM 111020]